MAQAPVDRDIRAADLILLLLAAKTSHPTSEGRVDGITRLEKLLFLLEKETAATRQVSDSFDFRPYNYGPYSKQVYDAIELLEGIGLVQEERRLRGRSIDEMEEALATSSDVEGVERSFVLTNKGRAIANLLKRRHNDVWSDVASVKRKYGDMSLDELIRYVYSRFPDYAENSLIRDQIL